MTHYHLHANLCSFLLPPEQSWGPTPCNELEQAPACPASLYPTQAFKVCYMGAAKDSKSVTCAYAGLQGVLVGAAHPAGQM